MFWIVFLVFRCWYSNEQQQLAHLLAQDAVGLANGTHVSWLVPRTQRFAAGQEVVHCCHQEARCEMASDDTNLHEGGADPHNYILAGRDLW